MLKGVTENCFAYLPLAVFFFFVMYLMYIEGATSSVISITSFGLLKLKHHINIVAVHCGRVSAVLLQRCLYEK